jgi:hypothetical protein
MKRRHYSDDVAGRIGYPNEDAYLTTAVPTKGRMGYPNEAAFLTTLLQKKGDSGIPTKPPF